MMGRFNRQDLINRAQAELKRRRQIVQQRAHWWSDAADAEFEAFRNGGPLPTSPEALELLRIHIELEEEV